MLESVIYHTFKSLPVGNRPSTVFAVLQSKEIEVPPEMVPPTSGNLFAILTTVDTDKLVEPSCDSLLALHPIIGRHAIIGSHIYPTILYWRDEFWVPVLGVSPDNSVLQKMLFGHWQSGSVMTDIIYRMPVYDLPCINDHFEQVVLPAAEKSN